MKNTANLSQEAISLIKKYKNDFRVKGQENFTNLILEAIDNGFCCVLEIRDIFKNANIDVTAFDSQLSKMLKTYKKTKELLELYK